MNFGSNSGSSQWRAEGGEPADKEFAQKHPLRILIADDNYINRRVLSLLLERMGYQAETTESGRDCLNEALHHPYDLLFIDIDMPGMSGIECTQLIRQAALDFPIVAVTATDPEVSRKQSFEAGMNGYIAKPVRLPELKRALLDACDAREKRVSQPHMSHSGV